MDYTALHPLGSRRDLTFKLDTLCHSERPEGAKHFVFELHMMIDNRDAASGFLTSTGDKP